MCVCVSEIERLGMIQPSGTLSGLPDFPVQTRHTWVSSAPDPAAVSSPHTPPWPGHPPWIHPLSPPLLSRSPTRSHTLTQTAFTYTLKHAHTDTLAHKHMITHFFLTHMHAPDTEREREREKTHTVSLIKKPHFIARKGSRNMSHTSHESDHNIAFAM